MINRPKILLTFRIGGENGGPFVSHKRILESSLSKKYELKPLLLENPRKLRNPKVFISLIKKIKQEKPAIVHLAGLQSEGFLTMLACKIARVKTIVAVHGSNAEALGFSKFAKFILRLMENYTVRNADLCYGVSDYVSNWNILNKAKHNFGTIYNIVNFSGRETKNDLRKELNISNDDIVVVSTGRITKDKGYDVLSDVALNILNKYSNVKFVIAGDGAYLEEFKRKTTEYKLNEKVFLLGYRADIDNILSSSDIFAICTKHETLCISLLEAASHKLPLVATKVGGIPEIIDEECGFLVGNQDVHGFCVAISKLIEDETLRKKMGDNASLKIVDKFGEESIITKLDMAYQVVIGG